jgi:DNA invertase Pin-like site-specific DNA recombinase
LSEYGGSLKIKSNESSWNGSAQASAMICGQRTASLILSTVLPRTAWTVPLGQWRISFAFGNNASALLYEIVREYSDVISGSKQKRPGLDQLMADARRHRFDIVLVAAFDRIARNVRHFLDVLDELNNLGIEFVSKRENVDTSGPLGRAMLTIVGAISELERSLIVERVRAGMRSAKLEGRRIGRAPLDIDRAQVVADRHSGMSLTQVAKKYRVSRATVCRLVNESVGRQETGVPQRVSQEATIALTGAVDLLAA